MSTQPELIETTSYFDFGEKYYHSPDSRIKSRYMHLTLTGISSASMPVATMITAQLRLKFSAHAIINACKYSDDSVKYVWAKNRFKPMPLGELTKEEMEAFTMQALQSEKYHDC